MWYLLFIMAVQSNNVGPQTSAVDRRNAGAHPQFGSLKSQGTNGLTSLGRAIKFLAKYHHNPLEDARVRILAKHFQRFGKRWNIDPWLAVSIACQESVFRDQPRRIRIRRCATEIRNGTAKRVCRMVWAGERGVMQVTPSRGRQAYRACKRRRLKRARQLHDTETSICVGMWVMAYRKAKIARKIRQRRSFMVRGARFPWVTRYAPCNKRQRKFCRNGHRALCKKHWWVASYNWGSHKVVCGSLGNNIDFAGYPIRVLRRYKFIKNRFKRKVRANGRLSSSGRIIAPAPSISRTRAAISSATGGPSGWMDRPFTVSTPLPRVGAPHLDRTSPLYAAETSP